MSIVVEEKPKEDVRTFEAIMFTCEGSRGPLMKWVSDAGDEDVFFCHRPGEDAEDETNSYILVAGEESVCRVYVGEWLLRFAPIEEDDENEYISCSHEDFLKFYNVKGKADADHI